MSASVNLSLHHKVQKFSSGTGSPGWSRRKGRKTVVVILETILIAQIWSTRDRRVLVSSDLECRRACVLSTERVAVVGPHLLIDGATLGGNLTLGRQQTKLPKL